MSTKNSELRPYTFYGVITLLISLHLGMGIHTAFRKTVTHDEIWHLPVGVLNWQTGQFDHDDLNPPFTRMWAGLPCWLFGPPVDEGVDATDIATKFVTQHDDYHTWYLWGRIFNLIFSVGTILIAVKWSREWFGDTAGITTALLCCTEPNLLAHSSLVTPDAGLMLAFTATLYLLNRWWKAPTWKLAIALGVVAGLAQGTKFTAVLLYVVIMIVGLLQIIRPRNVCSTYSRSTAQLVAVLLISVIAWNSTFLFRGTGRLLDSYQFSSQAMQSIQSSVSSIANFPVPFPEAYMTGIDRQRSIMEQPHPVFLDMEWSLTGFRTYFAKTMQYKLSHLLQAILGIGILTVLWRRRLQQRTEMLVLLGVPSVLLTGIASMSSMQLGVRYVLPVLPCLIMFTGPLAASLMQRSTSLRCCAFGLIGVAALLPLRHHPHHLAYFNEAAGGPVGGRMHLLDSNIDWGQDLLLLREFMDAKDLDDIGLVYFGTVPPSADNIPYHIPPPWRAEPGWYAVSVNFVMGRPHQIRQPDGQHRAVDFNEFGYFRQFEPVATLGGSIDVYHILP